MYAAFEGADGAASYFTGGKMPSRLSVFGAAFAISSSALLTALPAQADPILYGSPTGFTIHRANVFVPISFVPNSSYGAIVSGSLIPGVPCGLLSCDFFTSAGQAQTVNGLTTVSAPPTNNVEASNFILGSDGVGGYGDVAAFASLNSGDMAITSQTVAWDAVNGHIAGYPVGAYAWLWDTITFTGALANSLATIHMTGTSLLVGGAEGSAFISFDRATYSGYPINGCSGVPVNGAYDVSATIPISNNVPYMVLACIAGSSGSGFLPGNQINNDPIFFDLPNGVTYTSASGIFLQSPNQVPEPISITVFGVGLVGAVAMRRRKAKA